MNKSVYVVGGIGAVGCIMLSFMMQHLLKVRTDRTRSPVADEIQEACSEHLQGRVEVDSLMMDGEQTLVVRLLVHDDVPPESFARSVSDLVWRRAHVLAQLPERLRVEVRDQAGAKPHVLRTRPPGLDRLRAGHASRETTPKKTDDKATPGK